MTAVKQTQVHVMTSFKNLVAMAATALFVVSCAPTPPVAGPVIAAPGPDLAKIRAQNNAANSAAEKAKKRAAARKKKADQRKRELAQRAKKRRQELKAKDTVFVEPAYREPIVKKPVVKKPKYPTAKAISGKKGFVFNPYTYEQVDVRGIPSGSTVIDPNDPNKEKHKFKVP